MRKIALVFSAVAVAIVLVSGVAAALTSRCDGACTGTEKNDRMIGTEGKDKIDALGGDDVVLGKGGADKLRGYLGDDELVGGSGRDFLVGEEPEMRPGGADTLRGGSGDDSLLGGYGADTLYGGTGDDFLVVDGGETPDRIYCGDGFDRYDIGSVAPGDTSENVYVAPDCEKAVDVPSIYW